MIFLQELFNSALKCKRKGHKPKEVDRRIRTGMRDYRQKAIICRRCGEVIDEISREHLETYTSVTMPQRMWDEIREKGYVVL